MAELRELRVKVPIKFSEKAQKDLYETCMAYKKLAEVRGAENDKLRELVLIMHSELVSCEDNGYVCGGHKFDGRVRELGIEVE